MRDRGRGGEGGREGGGIVVVMAWVAADRLLNFFGFTILLF